LSIAWRGNVEDERRSADIEKSKELNSRKKEDPKGSTSKMKSEGLKQTNWLWSLTLAEKPNSWLRTSRMYSRWNYIRWIIAHNSLRSLTNQNCINLQCICLQNESCKFLQMNSKIDWLTDLPTTFNPLRIRENGSPSFLHHRCTHPPRGLLFIAIRKRTWLCVLERLAVSSWIGSLLHA